MSFLNATLIFGVAAIAVPIVLHLLARREPRRVVFPSVRFLTRRFETNRSRLLVRRWWLLALRIAALALLALALARPAIHSAMSLTWVTIGLIAAVGVALLAMASGAISKGLSRPVVYALAASAMVLLVTAAMWGLFTHFSGPAVSIDSAEPVAIAIVVDNSATSSWSAPGDDRIARIRELASWMVSRVQRTSRVAIVDRSGQVASFATDISSALSTIERLRPIELAQPISARIGAAARLLRTSDLPNRQILLVTDLTQSTWGDSGLTEMSTLLGDEPSIALTLFDLGEFDGSNRALSAPRLADSSPARGIPIPISTTLRLTTGSPDENVSVTAELEMYENDPSLPVVRDGELVRPKLSAVDRTSARVSQNRSAELLLTIPALEIGTHHGQIRLIGDDAIPLDDIRYFTLHVLPPSRILLVCDDPDEAKTVSHTITATAGITDEENAEFIVERIGYDDLNLVPLEDSESIILLDPPREAITDEALMEFINGGGGMLVCLGPSAGEEPLESEFVPSLIRRWRSPEPGTFFQVINTGHPVTGPVSSDTPWNVFRIRQYWQLETRENDSVLIQYAGTTHAALVERILQPANGGAPGRLLVMSTPIPALTAAARKWNDLFGSESFWPAWLLTRQSVDYLTRRGTSEPTVDVGRPQTIRLSDDDVDEPVSSTPARLQLFPPGDSPPVPMRIAEDATHVTLNQVARSGTYWLRGLERDEGFSANLPDVAIDLTRIDPSGLEAIFGSERFTLATSREEVEFAENQATRRVSLHAPVMMLALAVFLLEQLLSNWFYRSRRSTT